MLVRTCLLSLFIISIFGCPKPPDDPSPSTDGNSDGISDGTPVADAGSGDGTSDGTTDGSSPADAGTSDGSGDGTTDGTAPVDAGSSTGSSDGTTDGTEVNDSGSSDGTTDGTGIIDSGSSDGSSDGSSGLDGGSSGGSVEGLICDVADECIYKDSTIGETLTWQGCPAGQTGADCNNGINWPEYSQPYADALAYCENLIWGGFDDWVLPNIDEVRSLIRGCAKNEYGSSECAITHRCSYSVDDNCVQNSGVEGGEYDCGGCSSMSGPRSDGCYLPEDLPGDCDWLWSSSLQASSHAYAVSFYGGYVTPVNTSSQTHNLRCVRSWSGHENTASAVELDAGVLAESTDGGTSDVLSMSELCRQTCEHSKGCYDAACSIVLIGDIDSCTNTCLTTSSNTIEILQGHLNKSCETLLTEQCSMISSYCTCTFPQGSCPEGLYCMQPIGIVGVAGSLFCLNENVTLPDDGSICDDDTFCESNEQCLADSAGATTGVCVEVCTID